MRPEGEGSIPGGLVLGLGNVCGCSATVPDGLALTPSEQDARRSQRGDGRPSRRHEVPWKSIGVSKGPEWMGPGDVR